MLGLAAAQRRSCGVALGGGVCGGSRAYLPREKARCGGGRAWCRRTPCGAAGCRGTPGGVGRPFNGGTLLGVAGDWDRPSGIAWLEGAWGGSLGGEEPAGGRYREEDRGCSVSGGRSWGRGFRGQREASQSRGSEGARVLQAVPLAKIARGMRFHRRNAICARVFSSQPSPPCHPSPLSAGLLVPVRRFRPALGGASFLSLNAFPHAVFLRPRRGAAIGEAPKNTPFACVSLE